MGTKVEESLPRPHGAAGAAAAASSGAPAHDGRTLKLIVSDLSGPQHTILANTAWSVKELKVAIEAASGIPIKEQDVAADGDDVDDADLLGGPKLRGVVDYQLMDKRMMMG